MAYTSEVNFKYLKEKIEMAIQNCVLPFALWNMSELYTEEEIFFSVSKLWLNWDLQMQPGVVHIV